MPATLLSRSTYRERASLRSRLAALAMALGGAVLVLIALIELGILPTPTPRDLNTLRTFDVVPVASPARTVSRTIKPAGSAAPKAKPKPRPTPATAPTPTPPTLIQMDSATFAATDIGKMTPA